eukprot:TRINITY_DN12628_c0_g1_i1.p1 TRINITY_DN12628_c0_g1~~TRINITY_DN12628_c0_g1_i1.p1  ORF type:complete len:140 (-),score=36.40 TRINITY_DN12628_c0_g1_i1:288-707(-)
MSKIDLSKNKAVLEAARDAVLNDTTANRYVIFGYADSGQSNSLVVEEEEEGGLEELVSEFNSGRYQYGLTGVQSDGKGVKQILIIWQGEGTPILRKSACAHHAADVTKFMNVTMTVKARSEEELDADLIRNQLDKSSKY